MIAKSVYIRFSGKKKPRQGFCRGFFNSRLFEIINYPEGAEK
jgi:hypothetical protein